ncbi:hypothetical protein NDU88_002225 [Pleurodeles waltl]|uniref:IF rod domain-containing protein n=1 Tax=Pleurodeles waltl TaxID=8319 RepID=A0AAV7Q6A0_PLEWA|nr:hypothetical protein NDU88_002225 [Pleurodeles waltl]
MHPDPPERVALLVAFSSICTMAFFTTPGDCCARVPRPSIVAPRTLIESFTEDAAGKASAQHSTSFTGSMVSSSWDNSSKGGSFGRWLGSESSSIFENRSRQTMQNLNERLASYLDKVHNLEQSNAELEHKILERYDKQGASASIAAQRNHGHFYKTIEELRAKV